MKEDRKGLMEQEGITRKKGLEQIRDFHKGTEGVKENPPVQGKAPTDPVEELLFYYADLSWRLQGIQK